MSTLKPSEGAHEVYSFPAARQLVKGRWPMQAREIPFWHSLVNRPPNGKFPELELLFAKAASETATMSVSFKSRQAFKEKMYHKKNLRER